MCLFVFYFVKFVKLHFLDNHQIINPFSNKKKKNDKYLNHDISNTCCKVCLKLPWFSSVDVGEEKTKFEGIIPA